MKITVHHPMLPTNGGHTVFEGPDLDYRVEEGGTLRIIKWVTRSEQGDALFAAGQWAFVCRSRGIQ